MLVIKMTDGHYPPEVSFVKNGKIKDCWLKMKI